MGELHDLADRYAAMFRSHVEATSGIEAMFIVERPGGQPTAVPAFDTVEAESGPPPVIASPCRVPA